MGYGKVAPAPEMSAAIACVRPAAATKPAVARVGSNLMPLLLSISQKQSQRGPLSHDGKPLALLSWLLTRSARHRSAPSDRRAIRLAVSLHVACHRSMI